MKLKTYSVVLTILAATVRLHAQADTAFKERGGNRQEGVTSIQVGAPALELLSFTGYRQPLPADTGVDLRIRFYVPADTTLFLTAQELVPRRFYLMKPLQVKWAKGWQEFGPWPTGEVLQPLKIAVNQIGIVGRLFNEQTGSGSIVPVMLYSGQPATRLDAYTVQLKPKETLSSVRYSLLRGGSREQIQSEDLRKTFFAREPFAIILDMSGQPAGEYRLLLDCRVKNTPGGPKRTFIFYHAPEAPRATVRK